MSSDGFCHRKVKPMCEQKLSTSIEMLAFMVKGPNVCKSSCLENAFCSPVLITGEFEHWFWLLIQAFKVK